MKSTSPFAKLTSLPVGGVWSGVGGMREPVWQCKKKKSWGLLTGPLSAAVKVEYIFKVT